MLVSRSPALAVLVVVAALSAGAAAAAPARPVTEVVHLAHRSTQEALAVVRPLLSPLGTVEEQPAGNDLVLRDSPATLARIKAALAAYDRPPQALAFEIHLIRASPAGSPPPARSPARFPAPAQPELAPELVERLRGFLRYDRYEVLGWAGVASKEGEAVSERLGGEYSVSFRTGSTVPGERLKLEGFRIEREAPVTVLKGRRVPPRELFHASLNLQLQRPFALVLAEQPGADGTSQEGLMVAIVCRREGDGR